MASLLRAQKGKSDLTVDNDYHKQVKGFSFCTW